MRTQEKEIMKTVNGFVVAEELDDLYTIKNSSLRKLLDYDAQEIISWIDYLPVQYDDEEFADTLDDIIHE